LYDAQEIESSISDTADVVMEDAEVNVVQPEWFSSEVGGACDNCCRHHIETAGHCYMFRMCNVSPSELKDMRTPLMTVTYDEYFVFIYLFIMKTNASLFVNLVIRFLLVLVTTTRDIAGRMFGHHFIGICSSPNLLVNLTRATNGGCGILTTKFLWTLGERERFVSCWYCDVAKTSSLVIS
jgi:hypothetical protein